MTKAESADLVWTVTAHLMGVVALVALFLLALAVLGEVRR